MDGDRADGLAAAPARAANSLAVGVLGLLTAAALLVGVLVPYLGSEAGESPKLSESGAPVLVAFVLPAVLAGIVSLLALSGSATGGGVATGILAGLAGLTGIVIAVVVQLVGITGSFDGGLTYGAGFALHVAGVVLAGILALVGVVSVVAARPTSPRIHPLLGALGVVSTSGIALALLLPEDGFSIFDLEGSILTAYLLFAGVIAVVGIIGYATATRPGAGLGLGAAITPLAVWIAGATDDVSSGRGLFEGFSQGNEALFNTCTALSLLCGILALATARSAAPTSAAPAGSGPPHPKQAPAPLPPPVGGTTAEARPQPLPEPVSPPLPPPDGHLVDADTVTRVGARTSPRLVVVLDDGRRVVLDGLTLFGRDPSSAPTDGEPKLVAIDDPDRSVSKTHLAVGSDERGAWVEDRHALNGVRIVTVGGDERRLHAGTRVPVRVGETIRFGERSMVLAEA